MERLSTITHQFSRDHKGAGDVVICGALRSPLTRAGVGGLREMFCEDILCQVLQALITSSGIDTARIDDICVGCVLQVGSGAFAARAAQLAANIPATATISTVNRQCASGLQAVANIANSIRAGAIDVGIGAGMESMTHFDMTTLLKPEKMSQEIFRSKEGERCLIPMGVTSENVAEKFSITREAQDQFSLESHQKAAEARRLGHFAMEIVPIKISESQTIFEDDGIRENCSLEGLAKLKPAFKQGGTTTAGNSSQMTDGAAAVLLARRDVAVKLGLPILGRFVHLSVVGVPPEIMGIGPAVAIPKLLKATGLGLDDISFFEINEAFASQSVYCAKELNIPREKLNPVGGAIALGHPLGTTGARQVATLLNELRRAKKKFGVISMCAATGMGAAALIENEIL